MPLRQHRIPSMRTRLISVLVLFLLLPTLCLAFFLYANNFRGRRQEGIQTIDKELTLMAMEVEQLNQLIQNIANVVSNDRVLADAVQAIRRGATKGDEYDYYVKILDILSNNRISDDIQRIRVFLPDGKLITREGVNVFAMSDLPMEQLPEAILEHRANRGWSSDYIAQWNLQTARMDTSNLVLTYYYSANSAVIDQADYVLALDVSADALHAIISTDFGIEGTYFLLDDKKNVLATAGNEELSINPLKIPEGTQKTTEGELYVKRMPAGEWEVLAVVPMRQFQIDLQSIIWTIIGAVFLCLFLIPMLSRAIANSLLREIRELTENYFSVIRGEYKLLPTDSDTREIIQLKRTHNRMVQTIHTLVHDVYEERFARQEAQMISLVEQIKPHFLYNTLESGKWMALKAGDKKTAEFLEKLSQYFRLGLSGGREFVMLREELEYIQLYIDILNMRASQHIECILDVENDLMNMPILKMLLQPLVENAIMHGIKEKEPPEGIVQIKVCKKEDGCLLQVTDDGIGMEEAVMAAINKETKKDFGYGIQNIRARLRLYYGERCTLRYEAASPCGTRVSLHLKMSKQQTEKEMAN